MFELCLIIYICAVAVATYAVLKRHGLLDEPLIQQLQGKAILAEETMKTLHGLSCPLCGRKTFVGAVDFAESNIAVLICEGCGQNTLWKLDRYTWKMVAPYRWTPKATGLPAKVEAAKPEEEEVKLVFA